jgi:hypothetical protein
VLHGAAAPEVGSEIEADSDGFLPCYWHLDGVAVGQQALAAASWPLGELPACEARQECRDNCVQDATRECSPDAGDAGSSGQQGGKVQLTPWGDSIVFAETEQARLSVPASELSLVWGDSQQCAARFGDWASLPGAFPGGLAP